MHQPTIAGVMLYIFMNSLNLLLVFGQFILFFFSFFLLISKLRDMKLYKEYKSKYNMYTESEKRKYKKVRSKV